MHLPGREGPLLCRRGGGENRRSSVGRCPAWSPVRSASSSRAVSSPRRRSAHAVRQGTPLRSAVSSAGIRSGSSARRRCTHSRADRKTSQRLRGARALPGRARDGVERKEPVAAGVLQRIARERPEPHPAGVDQLRRFQVRGQPLVEPAGHPGHPAPARAWATSWARSGSCGERSPKATSLPEATISGPRRSTTANPLNGVNASGAPRGRGGRWPGWSPARPDRRDRPRRTAARRAASPDLRGCSARRARAGPSAAGSARSGAAPARHRRRTGNVRAPDEQQASCHEEAHRGAGDLTGRARAPRGRALRERPGWRTQAGPAPSRGEFRAGWKAHRRGIVTVAGQAAG